LAGSVSLSVQGPELRPRLRRGMLRYEKISALGARTPLIDIQCKAVPACTEIEADPDFLQRDTRAVKLCGFFVPFAPVRS